MEMSKKLNSEFPNLPDAVLSYIFSKLSIKDLVKTSVLSKQWIYEWRLRMDLNFDLPNMFDYNTIHDIPESIQLFKEIQSEFARRLNQFACHYQGTKIRSLRVNFPLFYEHSDVIARLISKVIDKGVERIELLFSYKTCVTGFFKIRPCIFPSTLLADTDSSLKYLHLENCLLVAPFEFSGLKNLRTLVLHLVVVEQDLLALLFSNCIHLVDLTLNNCTIKSNLNVMTLSLSHLKIVNCGPDCRRIIHIIAPNLSSFEYSSNQYLVHQINIEAHKLSKFSYNATEMSRPIGNFSGLKNLTTVVLDGLENCMSMITPNLFSECLQLEDVTFKNCTCISSMKIKSLKLRHLNIIDCGFKNLPYPKIYIDALNLSTFDYIGQTKDFSIKAPRLLKVFWNASNREKRPFPFDLVARLHQLENLAMTMNNSQISKLPKRALGPFQHLKHMEFFIEGTYDPNMDYFWILEITMASPHLQKLSLSIRNLHLENSRTTAFQRQRREYAGFYHDELRYVELHGCVGTINIIELASHFLKNVNSLKQITFSSHNSFYTGAGRWTKDSHRCSWYERNLIREMLKDEVNEQCQLKIL